MLVPPLDKPYLRESIAALGVPAHKIVEVDGSPLVCARLLAASQRMTAGIGDARQWPGEFLRRLFRQSPRVRRSRYFVVRGAVTARQLVNENEVATLLQEYGFSRLNMDGLTIREQAQLFSEAEALVLVHGAALANLVFCEAGTKVIELLPRNWASPLYGRLSQALQLDYHCVAGSEPALRRFPIKNLAADLKVKASVLKKVLASLNLALIDTGRTRQTQAEDVRS